MAEGHGVSVEGGKLLETSQTPANMSDAGDSPTYLPTLLIVVGEPLSETHKDTVRNNIATGDVLQIHVVCEGVWLFRPFAGSPPSLCALCLFCPWLVRTVALSLSGLFAPWLVRTLACSPPGFFASSPWTFCPC